MNFLQYRPTTLVLVIVICLAVVLAIQIIYYFCVYGKLIFNKKKKQTEDTGSQTEALPPVSVVIAAKNEEYHLKDKLVFFLEQDYPEFEVIVVNDASTDECEYVLKAFSKLYPCLKVVNIVENVNKFRGRKFPISLGIKSAKYDHIVLAGADCVPSGFEWLKNLARNFSEKKEVVLGFCTYTKQKGLFKFLLQYDNLTTAMNYMGLALSGHPYRGDGRNIAFKKDLFFQVGGFTKHYNLPLGEEHNRQSVARELPFVRCKTHLQRMETTKNRPSFNLQILQTKHQVLVVNTQYHNPFILRICNNIAAFVVTI